MEFFLIIVSLNIQLSIYTNCHKLVKLKSIRFMYYMSFLNWEYNASNRNCN